MFPNWWNTVCLGEHDHNSERLCVTFHPVSFRIPCTLEIISVSSLSPFVPYIRLLFPFSTAHSPLVLRAMLAVYVHIENTLLTQALCVFLGAFAKLRKATIRFIPVCSSAWSNTALTGRIFELSSKMCRENSSFIKSRQE